MLALVLRLALAQVPHDPKHGLIGRARPRILARPPLAELDQALQTVEVGVAREVPREKGDGRVLALVPLDRVREGEDQ
jgi:hypothetical protein